MSDACVLLLQLEEDFVKSNPEWVKELEIMVTTKVKAEIQALSSFGFQYLSQHYLPLKLQVCVCLVILFEVVQWKDDEIGRRTTSG